MLPIRFNNHGKSWQNKMKNILRITKIKPFINKYNQKETNFLLEKVDWKTFQKNNVKISLNVLHANIYIYIYVCIYIFVYIYSYIYPAYVLKHDSNLQNQVIILMIPNSGKWHYLAVKKLSTLLHEITSKHDGDFCCLNCLHSFRSKT